MEQDVCPGSKAGQYPPGFGACQDFWESVPAARGGCLLQAVSEIPQDTEGTGDYKSQAVPQRMRPEHCHQPAARLA